MNTQPIPSPGSTSGPTLYVPPAVSCHTARWRINGYGATIVIWTVEEWELLAEQPTDAQFYPCGVWCALRME